MLLDSENSTLGWSNIFLLLFKTVLHTFYIKIEEISVKV
jgi:hypothetical protein